MLLHLPDELLLIILAYIRFSNEPLLAKPAILSCRLVCKRLSNVGQGFAFQRIDFLFNEAGYRRLVELSQSPLRKEVRELNCYFDPFDEERASSQEAFAAGKLYKLDWTKEFELYRLGYQFQSIMEQDHQYFSLLTSTIMQFSNLRSMKLSRNWEYFTEQDNICHRPTKLARAPIGYRLFEAITDALAFTGNGIRALEIGSFSDLKDWHLHDLGLVGTLQRISPAAADKYQQAFWAIKTLKIHLPHNLLGVTGENELNYAGISVMIQASSSLEELHISFPLACVSAIPEWFLRSVKIPKLRVLDLTRATFEDPSHILDFLARHAATLKTVRFSGLELDRGSWETVFLGMRATLAITSSSIRDFYGSGSLAGICSGNQETIFELAISDFIQGKTDINPFKMLPQISEQSSSETLDWDEDL